MVVFTYLQDVKNTAFICLASNQCSLGDSLIKDFFIHAVVLYLPYLFLW